MAVATISRRQQAGLRRPRRGDSTILEALAILERRLREPGECLASPGQVRAFLMLHLAELEHEAFVVMFLDAQNRLIEAREMFRGTLTQTSVFPREIVRAAIGANAAAVIFAHNHPSGCAEPSNADELLTRGLKAALGLTGWQGGAAILAAGVCFEAWLAQRGGEGNQEERSMLAQVRGFLERHGEGRFTDWGRPVAKDDHAPRVQNRAGWRRRVEGESTLPDEATTEYLVYPQVFKEEVCKGFNATAVAKLLAARRYLKAEPNGGKLAPKFKPPGESHQRMYHVLPSIFEVE